MTQGVHVARRGFQRWSYGRSRELVPDPDLIYRSRDLDPTTMWRRRCGANEVTHGSCFLAADSGDRRSMTTTALLYNLKMMADVLVIRRKLLILAAPYH